MKPSDICGTCGHTRRYHKWYGTPGRCIRRECGCTVFEGKTAALRTLVALLSAWAWRPNVVLDEDFIPLVLVSQETYDEIDCNGCGDCCDGFNLDEQDPLTLILRTANGEIAGDTYGAMWAGQLTPTWREDLGYYTYSCGYFERSDDLQTGRCTAHDSRPEVCRNYPNGRDGTVGGMSRRCSWLVEIT